MMLMHRRAAIAAFLTFFGFLTSLPRPCAADTRPAPGVNNVWYATRSGDAVIVFVHGILSDSRGAWSHEMGGQPPVYWPELLRTDSSFDKYSIFLGGFHTAADSRNFGMRDAAVQLFETLQHKSVLDRSKIVFVTHSTGGIVVRHMLVREKEKFRAKKVGLLLIASPSLGSSYANHVGRVLNLADHQMGKELQQGNGLLVELDKDFFNMVANRELPGLIGREAFEHHFILGGILKFLEEVVPKDSAARYFAEPQALPQTDHVSAVKPANRDHPAYILLSNFIQKRFEPLADPACDSPNLFQLRFAVSDRADTPRERRFDVVAGANPILTLSVKEPQARTGTQVLARQPGRFYKEEIQLPCLNQSFRAEFTRLETDAWLVPSSQSLVTKICFIRKKLGPDLTFTDHQCVEGDACTPSGFDPGIAEKCGVSGGTGFLPNLFISTAHAQPVGRAAEGKRWTIPSLRTLSGLPESTRPGFTEFELQSGPLPHLADADRLTAAITVNGVAVLEDGWPAHSIAQPFDARQGLRYRFALQNLGFSGERDGKERIEVSLRFLLRDILVSEETLTREYVALRNGEPVDRELKSGGTLRWTATYRPPVAPDKFEIFLTSSKDVTAIRRFKERFDKTGLTFDKRPLVAVIRPPLNQNPNYGVVAGSLLENGQIRFTYDRDTADHMCRDLYPRRENPSLRGLIEDSIRRFENQPRAPGTPPSVECRTLMR